MKYQVRSLLLNLDGTTIKGPDGEAINFRAVCVACCVQAGDRSSEDKYACFRLAVKIQSADDFVELTAEEVSRIKRLIGETMPVMIVGRMFELLEQREDDGPAS